jgi:Spy/CpxP family protein refolding chaperone
MHRIRIWTAGALVASLVTAGVAFAQGPGEGRQGRGPGIGRGAVLAIPLGGLDLTAPQQDLIRDIRERARTEAEPLERTRREAADAHRAASTTLPVDEARVRATSLAVAEIDAELAVHRARMQNEIFAALTPDQQAKLTQAQAERAKRVAGRRGAGAERRVRPQRPQAQ